jgi:hypothetical protein
LHIAHSTHFPGTAPLRLSWAEEFRAKSARLEADELRLQAFPTNPSHSVLLHEDIPE